MKCHPPLSWPREGPSGLLSLGHLMGGFQDKSVVKQFGVCPPAFCQWLAFLPVTPLKNRCDYSKGCLAFDEMMRRDEMRWEHGHAVHNLLWSSWILNWPQKFGRRGMRGNDSAPWVWDSLTSEGVRDLRNSDCLAALGAAENFSLGTDPDSQPSRAAHSDWPSGHQNVSPFL